MVGKSMFWNGTELLHDTVVSVPVGSGKRIACKFLQRTT